MHFSFFHQRLLKFNNLFMATDPKSTLLLCKKDVVLVKPDKPTPSDVLSFSTIDNDYNLELLCQTLYVYQANISCSKGNCNNGSDSAPPQPDPALVIKEALSRALVNYYPLAGKLKRQDDGTLRITCNADGVPFLEAIADFQLSSLNYFDGIDVETAKQFVFDWPSDSDHGYHPLVLQVTKFSCGGFTIGMGLSHSVCDGFGASQFFRAMAELASGKSEPTVKPVWQRERLVGMPSRDSVQFEDKASLATSPFLPTTDLCHACFDVDNESIKRLKSSLIKECGNEISNGSFTTLEVLGAYVWRSRFRALKQNLNGKTIFCLAVGIRHLVDPPLPAGYYGNAFVAAQTIMSGRDLDAGPLSKVAMLIKESKKTASKHEHIQNSLNVLETVRQQNMKIESNNGASMVLTDWRQLGLLEEVDFGWKSSVNMLPLPWNIFGYVDLCIFMPPCRINSSTEGGVRVLVSFPREAMAKFKEEMDALKQGEVVA